MNKVPCFGHIGTGVLHPVFKNIKKIKQMYVVVDRLGGKINGELGIGLLNKEFVKEDFKSEFLKLKEKYDPEGILNKGKVVWANVLYVESAKQFVLFLELFWKR